MGSTIYNILRNRRQYILTKAKITCPFESNIIPLPGGYNLMYHPDLKITVVENKNSKIILMGDIYDYQNPNFSNYKILVSFIGLSFKQLLIKSTKYSGRFACIHIQNGNINLFHDASASRKIYYLKTKDGIACSSNPFILADLFDLKFTTEQSKLEYFESDAFKINQYANIGDRTSFEEIRQLLPNHSLGIRPFYVSRFWPFKRLPFKSDNEIVIESAEMIKGFIKAASYRYPLMLPLTAGYDSRVILAATRDIKEKVYYYLNVTDENNTSSDIILHKKILNRLGLAPHILNIRKASDPEFRDIYYKNNPLINPGFTEIFYNYLINFPDRLNLPGNTIPIISAFLSLEEKNPSPEMLSCLYRNNKYTFAHSFYEEWLNNLGGVCEKTGTDLYDLLFWEDKIANRLTQLQQDKDIAQEEYIVFSSAYLISLMISFTKEKRKKPYYHLHKRLIDEMWPELLDFPFNPSFKSSMREILINTNFYDPVLKVKKFLVHGEL